MSADIRTVPGPDDGLAMYEASAMLGIPAPTLRSWERRYGIPVTTRSAGGHRRYLADELNELRLMRDEVARGKRAADAALSVRVLLDRGSPTFPQVTQMLAACQSGRADDIRRQLDAARAELGLAATIDDIVLPALRQVGAWWEVGRCDIGQERVLTETVRGWLARSTALADIDTYEPPIILACGPMDLHTLGLEALAALLAEQRRGCRVLGPRPSELTLLSAAGGAATAVVIVSHLRTQRRPAVLALRSVAATGCAVFYAGNAFAFAGSRVGVPGTFLGETLAGARTILLDEVSAGSPVPRAPRQVA